MKSIAAAWLLFLFATAASIGAPTADYASGSASFDKHSATIKYGWLLRGPDEFDRSKSILRIYVSSTDVGAKIRACDSLSCVDQSLVDGGFVEYSDASYTNYWVKLDGGHVQFSGGSNATAFTFTVKQSNHLAGKLRIDDPSFHGAKLVIEFDLPLFKTFKK
jgi:hypothetical protein